MKQFIPITCFILLNIAVTLFLHLTYKNPTLWAANIQAITSSNLVVADFYPDRTEAFTRAPNNYAHGAKIIINNGVVRRKTDVTFTENWQKLGNLFTAGLIQAEGVTNLAETVKTKGQLDYIQVRVDDRGIPRLIAIFKANGQTQTLIATLSGVETNNPIHR